MSIKYVGIGRAADGGRRGDVSLGAARRRVGVSGRARVCAGARVVVSAARRGAPRQSAAASHARRLVHLSPLCAALRAAHLPPLRLRLSRSRAWRSRRPRASQFRSSAVSPRSVVHSTAAGAALLLIRVRLCWCVRWLRLAAGRRVLWQWNRESRCIVRMCSDGWVDRAQCVHGPAVDCISGRVGKRVVKIEPKLYLGGYRGLWPMDVV